MAAQTPLADVTDLSDWLGEPIGDDVDVKRAEFALRMATALVRRESGRSWLDDAGTLIDPLPDGVLLATLACAGRGYTNPEAWEDEAVDDWRGRRDVPEAFFLTDSERGLLSGLNGNVHGGLSTVGTVRGDLYPLWDEEGNERLLPPWY